MPTLAVLCGFLLAALVGFVSLLADAGPVLLVVAYVATFAATCSAWMILSRALDRRAVGSGDDLTGDDLTEAR